MNAELDERLDDEVSRGAVNRRNGVPKKLVLMGTSKIELSVPRDVQVDGASTQSHLLRHRR